MIDELVDVLELQLPQTSPQQQQQRITGGTDSDTVASCEESNSNCFDKMDDGTESAECLPTGESEMESLIEIKAAALRTLTAIIHLDGNPKLAAIIATTGATSYHGFLPTLVRACIDRLTATSSLNAGDVAGPSESSGQTSSGVAYLSSGNQITGNNGMPNLAFATALFSFLYHLASYESGCEALVSCGMVQSLLAVIEWPGCEPEHVTFVTRAVRVIDLITGLDMAAFQANGGLQTFIRRLEQEVDICRLDQPFVIPMGSDMDEASASHQSLPPTSASATSAIGGASPPTPMGQGEENIEASSGEASGSNTVATFRSNSSAAAAASSNFNPGCCQAQCFPQRAALLKSMLNFLKKVRCILLSSIQQEQNHASLK